jgi:hypothetical protein
MAAQPRKRTVYVKAEPTKAEKARNWLQLLWPIAVAGGAIIWGALGEWRDYSTVKETVGHVDPSPTGLVKKVGDLDGKIEKLSDGQKQTHSLVRDLSSQIEKVAKAKR